MIKKVACTILFAALTSASALAESSTAPIEAEILQGWVSSDGQRTAALRLSLAPGWKTYWRAPGDAGIPPEFDWSRSGNLDGISISWPTPEVFDQNGMRSVGYENTVTIPLHIDPSRKGRPVQLRATMELGICSDICIPHELQLDALIDSTQTRPTAAIAAALAQQPYTASEAGVTNVACKISPTAEGLQIEARISMPSAGAPEYVIIEPGPGEIWVSEAKAKRKGRQIIATSDMIHVNGGPIALDRSSIRLTVLGKNHAVDIRGCASG